MNLAAVASSFFTGCISEVQVAGIAWSPSQISLVYQTQASTSTAVSFGSPTPIGSTPILISPLNNAQNQLSPVNFSWNSIAAATAYELQASAATSFSSTVYDNATLPSTSQAVAGFNIASTYYWRVQASKSGSWTGWSSIWTFATALPVPALSTPTNGAAGLPVALTLNWSTSAGATSYGFLVATSSAFSTTVAGQTGLAAHAVALSGLQNGVPYWWTVNASNGVVTSVWSGAWSFATVVLPPNPPALSSPTNGTSILTNPITLTWGSAGTSYHLQVSTNSAFSTTISDQIGLSTTSLVLAGLANMKTYYWHISASNTAGAGAWSTPWSFTTAWSAAIVTSQIAKEVEFKVNGSTIAYSLKMPGAMDLSLFNMLGRMVYSVHRAQLAGQYKISLKSLNLAGGSYTVRFKAAGIEKREKVLLSR
jgi:hypothetical protein